MEILEGRQFGPRFWRVSGVTGDVFLILFAILTSESYGSLRTRRTRAQTDMTADRWVLSIRQRKASPILYRSGNEENEHVGVFDS